MRRRNNFGVIITLAIIAAFVILIFVVSDAISSKSINEQKDALETALMRDVVHCYALEGAYPESLDYIKEKYGLMYNEEKFFVDYTPIASNIMPDITIIEKNPEK